MHCFHSSCECTTIDRYMFRISIDICDEVCMRTDSLRIYTQHLLSYETFFEIASIDHFIFVAEIRDLYFIECLYIFYTIRYFEILFDTLVRVRIKLRRLDPACGIHRHITTAACGVAHVASAA